MPIDNMTEIIQESIDDVELPDEVVQESVDEVTDPGTESSEEGAAGDTSGLTDTQKRAAEEEGQTQAPVQDEFSKKFGIPSQSASGRENRIPYSRVQKIVAKNTQDITKQLQDKYTAELQPLQQEVTHYRGVMDKVGKFEEIMMNDPEKFVDMLKQLPAYKDYTFGKGAQVEQKAPDQFAGMPEPNPDGTYDLDGFKNALLWARQEAKREALEELQKQYAPLYQDWQSHQELQRLYPQVEAKLNQARTWPGFVDNEADILKALQADQNLDLDGAYRQVVIPKFISNANNQRQAVIKDMKKTPTSTAVSVGAGRVPAKEDSGPKSIQDIIRESIAPLKR